MRSSLASAVLLVVALPAGLVGCGDQATTSSGDGSVATDGPSTASSAPSAPSATTAVPSRQTCHDLYRPPQQLAPRAIDLVHGSGTPGRDDAAALASDLGATAATALPDLAADITVVQAGVSAVAEGGSVDKREFDRAVNRLARRCELYAG